MRVKVFLNYPQIKKGKIKAFEKALRKYAEEQTEAERMSIDVQELEQLTVTKEGYLNNEGVWISADFIDDTDAFAHFLKPYAEENSEFRIEYDEGDGEGYRFKHGKIYRIQKEYVIKEELKQ